MAYGTRVFIKFKPLNGELIVLTTFQQLRNKNRYRDVTRVCLPLVLAMSATTVMEFTDRIFLSNYSLDAVAAALPAGISAFLFMAFLGGIGGYSSVFIAQYTGRGEKDKVGIVLWQGIYFILLCAIFFFVLAETAGPYIFRLFDHPPQVRVLEEQYFSILCKGGVFHVALNTLSTFFSGRGITKPVMAMYFIGMAINIPLDYALIYGKFSFPEMGIAGAAIATVTASMIPTFILLTLIFTRKHNDRFGVFKHWQFDFNIVKRLLKFGVPGSLQFTVDIFAFTIFTLLVGKLGTLAMAATTVVLSINSVAFMPSMGFSQGISIMVGQALGKGNPQAAKDNVISAAHLLTLYILCIDALFIFFPETILSFFIPEDDSQGYTEMVEISINLLKIISAYLLFDSLYMIFSGALKGAGDTRFMMWSVALFSIIFLVIPCYLGIVVFKMGVYYAWSCILIFVISLFFLSCFRYYQGKWQDMLVIEPKEFQEK